MFQGINQNMSGETYYIVVELSTKRYLLKNQFKLASIWNIFHLYGLVKPILNIGHGLTISST